MIVKETYRAALARLPIENPTPEDIAQLCPHLSLEEAMTTLNNASEVACPSLRVYEAYRILRHYQSPTPYVTCDHVERKFFSDRSAIENKATRYAEHYWGNELVADTWKGVYKFNILDPVDIHTESHLKGFPKLVTTVYVCLNESWTTLMKNNAYPLWYRIDWAIRQMTLDVLEAQELRGGRSQFFEKYNCARCGSGLSLSRCVGCGKEFPSSLLPEQSWETSLPPKIVQFLQHNGHVFQGDSEAVRQIETQRHYASGEFYYYGGDTTGSNSTVDEPLLDVPMDIHDWER